MQDKLLTTLIDKFDSSSLAELEYDDGESRLVLRKGGAARLADGAPPASLFQAAPPAPAAEERPPASRTAASEPRPLAAEAITSPIVATFYAAPGPDSPAFVKKGDHVKKGQTLCILEAMKMMNNLEAEYDCTILDIKVKSGELVEFGQVLFEVERT